MRNHAFQRRLRKTREEKLDMRNLCGIRDPTPFEAVKHIILCEQKGGDPTAQPESPEPPQPSERNESC